MPDDPPCAGSLAAIEPANFSIRLKPLDRRNVRHHHAVAHRDAAGRAAEIGAAAGDEAAFLLQRLDRRKRQDDHVGLLAADEAVPVRADGVEMQLDLVAAGALVNSGASSLDRPPSDRARAHAP